LVRRCPSPSASTPRPERAFGSKKRDIVGGLNFAFDVPAASQPLRASLVRRCPSPSASTPRPERAFGSKKRDIVGGLNF
ncbi:hypothetical protein CTI14_68595, partial [Methylobacterium radiotolerans]